MFRSCVRAVPSKCKTLVCSAAPTTAVFPFCWFLLDVVRNSFTCITSKGPELAACACSLTEISLFETQRPRAKFVNEASLEAKLWLSMLVTGLVHVPVIPFADGERSTVGGIYSSHSASAPFPIFQCWRWSATEDINFEKWGEGVIFSFSSTWLQRRYFEWED